MPAKEIPMPPMLVANVLSDLTSLRLCDPTAATAFTSAATTSAHETSTKNSKDNDPDMTRAYDIIELHNTVKTTYAPLVATSGSSTQSRLSQQARDLLASREAVRKVIEELGLSIPSMPAVSVISQHEPSTESQADIPAEESDAWDESWEETEQQDSNDNDDEDEAAAWG